MTETAITGQPTKLTPQMEADIATLIAKGNYITTACNACGIATQTYDNWLEWGSKGREPYLSFFVAIKRAEAEAEARRVERIEEAGIGGGLIRKKTITQKDGTVIEDEQYAQPQWLADMTHLERRHPDRWGRKDRTKVDVSGKIAIPITHVDVILTGEIVDGEYKEIEGSQELLKEGSQSATE